MQIRATYIHLIDLDALLDTRLGAVSHFSHKHALKLLEEGWQGREMDRVIWTDAPFSEAAYKEHLGRGYKETLMASGPTMLPEYIKGIVQELLRSPDTGISEQTHEFLINLYPYSFTDSEKEELREVIWQQFPFAVSVKLISQSHNSLSPVFLKDKGITHFYLYSLGDWIKRHIEAMESCPNPQLNIFGPAIMERSLDELENNDELKLIAEHLSPFDAMSLSLCVYASILYVEPSWFSLIDISSSQQKGED